MNFKGYTLGKASQEPSPLAQMKRLVIIGAGGFAREVAWLVEGINSLKCEWDFLGFIDEDPAKHGKVLNGYPVLGDFDYFQKHNENVQTYAVCAVGSPQAKLKLVKRAEAAGLKFANLVHPGVLMSSHVELGVGNIICAGSIISTNVRIGSHVSINPASTVGHDSVIEDYATILWSVNISGNCTVGAGCEIGTNATVIQGKTIGRWSVIGAGAVVVRDIPPICTAVGVPARPIKFRDNELT